MAGVTAVILARHDTDRGRFGVTAPLAPERDAAALRGARRALVIGCHGLAAETTVRACDLAEALGAAFDGGRVEMAQAAGPTIARIGEVTADPEELRDRADLVVFWFCDPVSVAPDFLRRFVTSATAAGRPRHAIAVGPVDVATSSAADRHLPVDAADAVDLARLLHAAVTGTTLPAATPALAAASDALATAIGSAGCIALVTHHRDPVGLEPWSIVGLLRGIAHGKPAFEVPLEPAGASEAVCAWRYGAAGAVARADRDGADVRPAECDAARLVARGEVDCVVAVGRLPETVAAAVATRGRALDVIRLVGDDASLRAQLDALVAAIGSRGTSGAAP